jgi:hypothetical protein
MNTKKKFWAGIALGAAVAAAFLGLRAPARRAPEASEDLVATPATSAPHRHRLYPLVPAAPEGPEAPPESPGAVAEAPASAPVAALAAPTELPPSPPQTATSWITSFREAVCGCRTRECVRGLQTRFVHAVGTTDYDQERDGAMYSEASRAAIKCYAALPENS